MFGFKILVNPSFETAEDDKIKLLLKGRIPQELIKTSIIQIEQMKKILFLFFLNKSLNLPKYNVNS